MAGRNCPVGLQVPGTQPPIYSWCRAFARAERFNIFSRPVLGAILYPLILTVGGVTYIKLEKETDLPLQLLIWVSNFRCVASFRNYSVSDAQIRPIFAHFTTYNKQLSYRRETAMQGGYGPKCKSGTGRQYLRTIEVYIQPVGRI